MPYSAGFFLNLLSPDQVEDYILTIGMTDFDYNLYLFLSTRRIDNLFNRQQDNPYLLFPVFLHHGLKMIRA